MGQSGLASLYSDRSHVDLHQNIKYYKKHLSHNKIYKFILELPIGNSNR